MYTRYVEKNPNESYLEYIEIESLGSKSLINMKLKDGVEFYLLSALVTGLSEPPEQEIEVTVKSRSSNERSALILTNQPVWVLNSLQCNKFISKELLTTVLTSLSKPSQAALLVTHSGVYTSAQDAAKLPARDKDNAVGGQQFAQANSAAKATVV